jgi:RHS repeat-associated protein
VYCYRYDAWGYCTITATSGISATDANVLTNINPFRYRGYYYDVEIGMYYLQSRYYDARVARFICSDEIIINCFDKNCTSHNAFIYVLNQPINLDDPSGYWFLVDDLAILSFIGLCATLMLLLNWMSTSQFKQGWNDFCAAIGNGLAWISTSIVNGGKAAWNWMRKQVKAATTAITLYITVARADSKIRTKVKRNSKQRYWAASITKSQNYTYVIISSAISYSNAKNRVACGLCVFTVTRTEARQLAGKFPPRRWPRNRTKRRWSIYALSR